LGTPAQCPLIFPSKNAFAVNGRQQCPLAQEFVMTATVRQPSVATPTAGTPPPLLADSLASEKQGYETLVRDFQKRARSRGLDEVTTYYWYHTIDLGHGLVTPGDYDFRPALPEFHIPADLTGKKVLDVGAGTGFFTFEFEKRGASVTAVDLPSLADWDMCAADKTQTLDEIRQWCQKTKADAAASYGGQPVGGFSRRLARRLMDWFDRRVTQAEADKIMLHGGFEFCRQQLNSKVQRCLSPVYDLSRAKLGAADFDLVFAGDMLVHTMAPLKALNVLASLCRGTLIISQDLPDIAGDQPVMQYFGGTQRGGDNRSWWHPNLACWKHMLQRLGFADVQVVGRHQGTVRRQWIRYDRMVIHASK
jgi:2-polyprenyl-3-methyl-5-hydroxy-6-metoxy-1,4-benzoquinol methylase